MYERQESSPFKFVFWGILLLCVIGLMGQAAWYLLGGLRAWSGLFGFDPRHFAIGGSALMPGLLTGILPTITVGTIWIAVIAPVVYSDAKKRGMDPWLWATVATFIPFLIGIIIYLVARSNGRATCENCGRPIRSDFKACPYCGHTRVHVCPQCGRPVSPDWKLCPYCARRLAPEDSPASG